MNCPACNHLPQDASLVFTLNRKDIRNRIKVSFPLDIPGLGQIQCVQILRGVQGKRLVCLARQGNNHFVVKLFFHQRRAASHWKRSHQGITLLQQQAELTPAVRYFGYLKTYKIYILVLEYINKACSVTDGLAKCRTARDRLKLIKQISSCLARQHEKGLIQLDLNPGNFLICKDKIFTIDGEHIQQLEQAVDKHTAINSLASFFLNIPSINRQELRTSYTFYARYRNWDIGEQDINLLLKKISRMKIKKKARRLLRVLILKKKIKI